MNDPMIVIVPDVSDEEFIAEMRERKARKKAASKAKLSRRIRKMHAFADRLNATADRINASNERLKKKWFGKK